MKRNNKKGFTIVELVIVIAVIAILAGVLIPTFSSIVRKANLSADQQAVRQMNEALAIEEISINIDNINKVHMVLLKAGFNAESYKPLTVDTRFVWIKSKNRVIHVDSNNNILYPSDLAEEIYLSSNWFDLAIKLDPNRLYLQDAPMALISGYNGSKKPPYDEKMYVFMPTDDNSSDVYEEQRAKYGNWVADFAIILNDDLKAETAGICGQYLSLNWEQMLLPEDATAGTTFLLMQDGFQGAFEISYELLLTICAGTDGNREGFNCGAFNLSEENIGKSITVQLRLYEIVDGEKTGKYVVCNEVCHIFNFVSQPTL